MRFKSSLLVFAVFLVLPLTTLPPSHLISPSLSVVPTANGRKKFKVVYVVLESQYQSTLTAACTRINEKQDNVCVECVGYLLEELRNPETLEDMRKDVADADIFIGSLIFIQELAEKVRRVLCLVFPPSLPFFLSPPFKAVFSLISSLSTWLPVRSSR